MEGARRFPRLIRDASPQTDPSTTESKETSLLDKKIVDREYLINKLNYINFQDRSILVRFRHTRHNKTFSVRAKPLPCDNDTLDCLWVDKDDIRRKIKTTKFECLHIPNGQNLLIVEPQVLGISKKGCRLRLPESFIETVQRSAHRHYCSDVNVQLIQSGVKFSGKMIDFSPNSFRIEIKADPLQSFHWIITDAPVTVILDNDTGIIYSGDCRIIRHSMGKKIRKYVLRPVSDSIQRFKPKEYRSRKHKLTPSPNVMFMHPFTKRLTNLKVNDLSGAGLSIEENQNHSVLMPGMIIPEMELQFTNSFKIRCISQVVYRQVIEEDVNARLKYGLVFLDMKPEDSKSLLGLLHQTDDEKAYVSSPVDMEALWNFFFEAGFIYPKKYKYIQENKEKIKEIYEKLYTQCPSIARHYIYQDNGRILAHMAMIRYYHRTWLIHHHAANVRASNKAGLIVLSQISHYINDVYNIYSHKMDYVYCYFRPENKFPNKIFGGVSKHMKNPKGCSLDSFAYFHFKNEFCNELDLLDPWNLSEAQQGDLAELEDYYEDVSGGLMVAALDLEPDRLTTDDVSDEYNRLGFKRKRYLYSLKKDGKLKAVVMINISDVGLNMSDLTNCIKVIVTDPDDLPKNILSLILSLLIEKFEQKEMPVLLFPAAYADAQAIAYEKQYIMWVLNLQYSDGYFRFLTRLLKHI